MDKYVSVNNEVRYAENSVIELIDHKVLARDGFHNAFPSLCRFKNALFTAFRRGTAHRGQGDGKIIICRSDDEGSSWQETACISTEYDMRDPFIFAAGNELMLYSCGLYELPEGGFDKYLYTYSSSDGVNFTEFTSSGLLENSFFWGCAAYRDGFIATAYHNVGDNIRQTRPRLYFSKDARNWEKFTDLPDGNEVSLTVDNTGELHCIVRYEEGDMHPNYCSVSPDGTYKTIKLSLPMQGIMFEAVGDKFIIAARCWDWLDNDKTNHRIDMFVMDRSGKLTLQCTLPSGGDCSYGKCLPIGNNEYVMVYYSQHHYLGQLQQVVNQNLSIVKRSNDMYVCRWKYNN